MAVVLRTPGVSQLMAAAFPGDVVPWWVVFLCLAR